MKTTFIEQMGRPPGEAETNRMIAAEVDEEMLFREALSRGLLERDSGVQTRLIQKMLFLQETSKEINQEEIDQRALLARAVELGLHQEDIVVRRILVQKMKLLGSALEPEQRPAQDEIESAYRSSHDKLRAPDRRSLVHTFFSSDRRGPAARSAALALLKVLEEEGASKQPSSVDPTSAGDPFPLGQRLENRSQHDLERAFGGHFGAETFDLAPETWSAPIASAYGFHLVRVDQIQLGSVPPLDQVAERLRLEIEERRRNHNLEALVSDLRTRYQVVLPNQGAESIDDGSSAGPEAMNPSAQLTTARSTR